MQRQSYNWFSSESDRVSDTGFWTNYKAKKGNQEILDVFRLN